ncbi:hypothetical protein [Kitasatospora indigofera]|uniref:hypothetical protein n=1 Tax=Kitasatospora indigofera TaxID=67307 RepID=UPI0033BAF900
MALEQRAAGLRGLVDAELIELALGRWGGPESDVLDEYVRRLQDMLAKLRPALAAMKDATGTAVALASVTGAAVTGAGE